RRGRYGQSPPATDNSPGAPSRAPVGRAGGGSGGRSSMAADAGLLISGTLSRRRALLARLARTAGEAPLEVFCSGIGGTGLSGLARLLAALGHHVRGSDQARGPLSEAVEAAGIEVAYGQRAENVGQDVDVFVATAALPPNHPELVA